MSEDFIHQICNTAKTAALAAGELQKQYFHHQVIVHETLKHDLKLETDQRSEQLILEILQHDFPDFPIFSEESGIIRQGKNSSYVWIVDPLDGSVNYYFGIPYFCVCIACYQMTDRQLEALQKQQPLDNFGTPVAGVVYAPLQDEMYYAVAGDGAFCNDTLIHSGEYQNLSECLVLLTCGSLTASTGRMAHLLPEISHRARKVRMFGATGLDIVSVARGGAGVFFQEGPHIWDFAASCLILQEAGGRWEQQYMEGGRWRVFACVASENVWQEMKEILKSQEVGNI